MTAIVSYPIAFSTVVRSLGPPARLSMFDGGGERARYQHRWACGCVVMELDRHCRIVPCDTHREVFAG